MPTLYLINRDNLLQGWGPEGGGRSGGGSLFSMLSLALSLQLLTLTFLLQFLLFTAPHTTFTGLQPASFVFPRRPVHL